MDSSYPTGPLTNGATRTAHSLRAPKRPSSTGCPLGGGVGCVPSRWIILISDALRCLAISRATLGVHGGTTLAGCLLMILRLGLAYLLAVASSWSGELAAQDQRTVAVGDRVRAR